MFKKELTCIGCPMGCGLTVTSEQDLPEGEDTFPVEMRDELTVKGNTCPIGDDYARKELTDPRRIVTSTVRVKGGSLPSVSVKTDHDIPKKLIGSCMSILKDVEVDAPVKMGQILVENVCGTGSDIVATKNVSRAQ